jgi:aspartate/methionine/tyrosine aminotransferase
MGCWGNQSDLCLEHNTIESELRLQRKARSYSPSSSNYRHKLHVIMDEVYMLSVFDESIKFHSVLSIER